MSHWFRKLVVALAGIVLSGAVTSARSEEHSPLQLEAKILLGHVRGRIDHMAVDLKRQRLFIAELGNDSVGVVDLAIGRVIRTISGLNEPQGVGYEPTTDILFVANARDGSVKLFDGNDYKAKGQIELGSDADNIRIDAAAQRVIVGYGDGALAYLDATTGNKVQNAPLKAHPESFPARSRHESNFRQPSQCPRSGRGGRKIRKTACQLADGQGRKLCDGDRPRATSTSRGVP
ncbi:YncE family protein [Bradyrhizobium iriomotense]|nr:hypothetical protein [Bradyrhizobium iriomotense]